MRQLSTLPLQPGRQLASGLLAPGEGQLITLAGGAWSPLSLANLAYLFRPDAGVTSVDGSTNVISIADTSPHALSAAQATSASRPAWIASGQGGKPAIRYGSGTNVFLSVTDAAVLKPAAFTIWAVATFTALSGTFGSLVVKATSSAWNDGYGLSGRGHNVNTRGIWINAYNNPGSFADTGVLSTATPYLLVATYGTTGSLAIYRTSMSTPDAIGTTTSAIAHSTHDLVLGCSSFYGTTAANCDVGEHGMCAHAMTLAERDSLATYVTARYGFAVSL